MKQERYEEEMKYLKELGIEPVKCCAGCSHLMPIRKHGLFAVCKLLEYTFYADQIDTRTVTCHWWEDKND